MDTGFVSGGQNGVSSDKPGEQQQEQPSLRVQKLEVPRQTQQREDRGRSPNRSGNMGKKKLEPENDSLIDFVVRANLPVDRSSVDGQDKELRYEDAPVVHYIDPTMSTYERELIHISRMTLNHRPNDPPTWKKLAERVISVRNLAKLPQGSAGDRMSSAYAPLPKSANMNRRTVAWVTDPHDLEQERVSSGNIQRIITVREIPNESEQQPVVTADNIVEEEMANLPIFHEKMAIEAPQTKLNFLENASRDIPVVPSNSPELSPQQSFNNESNIDKRHAISAGDIASHTSSMDITVVTSRPNTSASQCIHKMHKSPSDSNVRLEETTEASNRKHRRQRSLDFCTFEESHGIRGVPDQTIVEPARVFDRMIEYNSGGGDQNRLTRSSEEIFTIGDTDSSPLHALANVSESFPPISRSSNITKNGGIQNISPIRSNNVIGSDPSVGIPPLEWEQTNERKHRPLLRQRSLGVISLSHTATYDGAQMKPETGDGTKTHSSRQSLESLSSLPPVESYPSLAQSDNSGSSTGLRTSSLTHPDENSIVFPQISSSSSAGSNPKSSGAIVARRPPGRARPRLMKQKSMDFSLLLAGSRRITPPETPTRADLPMSPGRENDKCASSSINRRGKFRSDPDITSIREGDSKHERKSSVESNHSGGGGTTQHIESTLRRVNNQLRKNMSTDPRATTTGNPLLAKRRHKLLMRMKSSPVIKIPPQLCEKPERNSETKGKRSPDKNALQEPLCEVDGENSRDASPSRSPDDTKLGNKSTPRNPIQNVSRKEMVEKWLEQCESEQTN
ncbi:uncharacterized protein LOC144359842 [Saccoglossus kowalevskii]